jgi:heptosyltransferase-2
LKILIIKTGYSETLDPEVSRSVSLGDVLRTTVLLNRFKNDEVSWLVDERALPIIMSTPFIKRPLVYDLSTAMQLQAERFDTIINLEKVPGLCVLADKISATRRYGFRYDPHNGVIEGYDFSQLALSTIAEKGVYGEINNGCWSELLYKIVGTTWRGEEYCFKRPEYGESFGVGFNFRVGSKWPRKAWPRENWDELRDLIKENGPPSPISWQPKEVLDDLEKYFDWVNSCRLIITNDSLGLHLAIALKKKVVALFGPSNPNEVHIYGRGKKLVNPEPVEVHRAIKEISSE